MRSLLDRVGRLGRVDAQLLWTVLRTELPFRLELLGTDRGDADGWSYEAA